MLFLLETIFFSDPVSWILQLVLFYSITRWNRIKWEWAIFLLLGLEYMQLDLEILKIEISGLYQPDLIMDILFGCIGIHLGKQNESNEKGGRP